MDVFDAFILCFIFIIIHLKYSSLQKENIFIMIDLRKVP